MYTVQSCNAGIYDERAHETLKTVSNTVWKLADSHDEKYQTRLQSELPAEAKMAIRKAIHYMIYWDSWEYRRYIMQMSNMLLQSVCRTHECCLHAQT